ncbi:MAG: magnesium/cobalt transporter CorA [Candidatus Krumholzibacteria bacterium]|nr:magnesium/cobalt transporter CorA [Candidatus Krumholzibacteria bacterium]
MHRQPGLAPGTLVHIGEKKVEDVRITVMDFDGEGFREKIVESVDECFAYRDKPTTTWINVDGVHDVRVVEKLGACYGIHPIVLEDVVNTVQRPKMLDFGDYIFLSLKMLYFEGSRDRVKVEQVSLILGLNFVISFQEDVGDVFDPVRDRIRKGTGKLRRAGADFLAYSLIDSIVDGYFTVFEWLGERIEEIQERLIVDPTAENLQTIHHLKSEMIELRKAVWPLREVIANLERVESPLVRKDTLIFLRNVYGHTIEIIETIESFRDLMAGMIDIYLSSLSMKLNEVMKVLTIIATIFIPLTFVVGIYGMNFDYMPECRWHFGYPMVMLVVLTVGVSMLVYFRKKKWL